MRGQTQGSIHKSTFLPLIEISIYADSNSRSLRFVEKICVDTFNLQFDQQHCALRNDEE